MSQIIAEIVLLLDKKIEYLEEMLSITKEQKQTIQNEELQKLESFLDKKDSLIQEIDKIDNLIKQETTDELLENQEILKKKSDIKGLISDIKIVDDENNKNLKTSIDEMKVKLKKIRQGQRVMKKYDNSDPYKAFTSYGGTLFIDEDS